MKKLKYLIIVFYIMPVILAFFYIYLFSVNVPFWDEWELVPYFDKFYSRNLTWSDLFAQHSDHIIFFPRILILIIGILSKYNTVIEIYFTMGFFLLSLIIIFLIIKNQCNINPVSFWLIPLPYLIFSWRQYELFLTGFNIQFLMVYFFTITGFYSIYLCQKQYSIIYFISALISGTVASFSGTMGLFIWPAGFIQLMLLSNRKVYPVFWSITGILEWTVFLLNYKKPDNSSDIFYFSHRIPEFLNYFLTCLGTSLFWDKSTALIWAVIFFILLSLCIFLICKYKRLNENSFWVAMLIFSFLTVLSISAGRLNSGIEQAFTPRYTVFSLMAVTALYCMFLDLLHYSKKNFIKILTVFLFLIIFAGLPCSYGLGLKAGMLNKKDRTRMTHLLLTYETQSDDTLKILYAPDGVVRQRAEILKKWGWSVFSR